MRWQKTPETFASNATTKNPATRDFLLERNRKKFKKKVREKICRRWYIQIHLFGQGSTLSAVIRAGCACICIFVGRHSLPR
jgi:hypothetical protein